MRRPALICTAAALSCGAPVRMPGPEANGSSSSSDTDPTLAESSSSTSGPTTQTETSPDTETTGPTSETTTTTGPTGCQGPDDCSDPALAFCVDEVCVTCSAASEPDAACAQLDETAPLCIEDACVQCSAENTDACGGVTPLCDVEASTCVACEFHEQCQDIGSPACNFVTGACFDPANVTPVDLSSSGALQAAINGVDDGAEHTIVVTGSAGVSHNATVDGGKVIAFVSTNTSTQTLAGLAGNPTLTLTGADTTVFLHRLQLTANTDDVGVSVEANASLFADSVQVSQNSGGGITLAAGTSGQLRNCMVAGPLDGIAVDASASELLLLYSSVLGSLGDADALSCTTGTNVGVRNSIITTRGDNPALSCPGASVDNTAVENTADTDWFSNYNAGDALLTAAGRVQFMGDAIWEDGDPPFDFRGGVRPAVDGSPDFPGAGILP